MRPVDQGGPPAEEIKRVIYISYEVVRSHFEIFEHPRHRPSMIQYLLYRKHITEGQRADLDSRRACLTRQDRAGGNSWHSGDIGTYSLQSWGLTLIP